MSRLKRDDVNQCLSDEDLRDDFLIDRMIKDTYYSNNTIFWVNYLTGIKRSDSSLCGGISARG